MFDDDWLGKVFEILFWNCRLRKKLFEISEQTVLYFVKTRSLIFFELVIIERVEKRLDFF